MNPAELARQTVALLEPYANERGVSLRIDDQLEGAPEIDADGRALQQALINLVDNAIKHSAAGQTVTIGLETSATRLRLWVQDQGKGIPPENHARIFEPFFRVGSELRRETEGIGIGLTIVKHVAEAHGGSVQATSDAGRGSRFCLDLPRNGTAPIQGRKTDV